MWDGASQHRGQGRTCSHYSLAGLRGGGLPGARMETSSPPLPLPQCCSAPFAQCCQAKTPPQTGDGGGWLKGQTVTETPLYAFFFFTTNPPPQLGFPPVSMAIAMQGEGLLAILSTDCLGSKSATVPSPGWRGGRPSPSPSPILDHLGLHRLLPSLPRASESLALGAALFETASLRSWGLGAAAFCRQKE